MSDQPNTNQTKLERNYQKMSKKKKLDPFEEERVDSVEAVKAELSPATPCVHADAEGYCTGACEGSICCHCADYKPVTAVATKADAPLFVLEHPAANLTPAENVQFDLAQAKKHGAMTLAYLARAGWRLACEKQGIGYGAWDEWIEKNVGISKSTADRYIKFYYSTVGEHLRAQGTAHRLVEDLTDKMIAEATAGLESKTATGAMIELGIVKRPAGWGGEREGAGRKAAAAAAAAEDGLSDQDSATVMWINAMAPFERDRAAFHSAARDLRPEVARRFLSELEMLVDTLEESVGGKPKKRSLQGR